MYIPTLAKVVGSRNSMSDDIKYEYTRKHVSICCLDVPSADL
jgi:hypothetical protein